MQYRPTAAELLSALATLLDDVLLPALPPGLQHQARVGGNIARILEREQLLGPAAVEHEKELLAEAIGVSDPAELARMLREGVDSDVESAAWTALVAVARDDLAVAKPGYDGWEGR
ncbi:DUF6285 domain-containing protein [Aldersonia kunmingensis]|uniref:DUF6285 domain-containing protein n=1 Tax=Aldersonia kunmingensis TaxID=408066 RepID=UPI00082EB383|nr:DUF6285 domain-containing protein [Aldersonia kunmingensis]